MGWSWPIINLSLGSIVFDGYGSYFDPGFLSRAAFKFSRGLLGGKYNINKWSEIFINCIKSNILWITNFKKCKVIQIGINFKRSQDLARFKILDQRFLMPYSTIYTFGIHRFYFYFFLKFWAIICRILWEIIKYKEE